MIVSGGYRAILLGISHQIIDVWGQKAWATIFVWVGANAIVVYFSTASPGRDQEIFPSNQQTLEPLGELRRAREYAACASVAHRHGGPEPADAVPTGWPDANHPCGPFTVSLSLAGSCATSTGVQRACALTPRRSFTTPIGTPSDLITFTILPLRT